jgi:DNA-binding IclR family transcriptional regulator
METKPQSGVQTIHRAIAILRALSDDDEKGLRLSKIATKVDLHVTTTRRILLVLCAEGFAAYNPATKLYHIGPEMYALTDKPRYAVFRKTYRSAIENIANKTGNTVHLTVRSGNETLCVDRCEGQGAVRIVYELGRRTPLGLGAGGMAILSVLKNEEVDKILAENKKSFAEFNLTIKKVKSLIKLARKLGYAVNDGNTQKGVTAVAIPLFNNQNAPTGAIAVASVSEQMGPMKREEVIEICRAAIAHITKI